MANKVSKLGLNIKKYREKKKWSLYRLKEETGLSYSTLHDIENGKSQNLSTKTLQKIATALDVNVEDLLEQEQNNKEINLQDELENILSKKLELDEKLLTAKEKDYLKVLFNIVVDKIREMRNFINKI